MIFTPIPEQIKALLETAIENAFKAGDLPEVKKHSAISVAVKPAKQSNYASPVAMASSKLFQMKPLEVASVIAKHLPPNDLLAKTEVAAPGFINFWLDENWIRNQLNMIIESADTVFAQNLGQGKRVMVEFVSANPTGPLHVGRSRGACIGDGIARLLEACGWKVHREYYFNNGGRQMEMLGRSLQARYLQALGQEVNLPEDGYQGEYLINIGQNLCKAVGDTWKDKDWQAFKEYAEKEIFKSIEATLLRLGIKFDLYFNELDLYDSGAVWKIRDDLEFRGHTYTSMTRENASEEEIAKAKAKSVEPATWFRSTAFGDDEDRVIVRSNGDPTYVLPDIAYHIHKLDRGFDRVINILGADHFTESQVVKYGLKALGYDADKVDVVLHQMVHLVRGDQKIGMSTRRGEIIPLDAVMDETGTDAIRYFLVSRSADNDISFDLDLAVKQSNENPVFYIQNAHVRCAGILRQLEERGYPADWDADADLSYLEQEEIEFALKMLDFPDQLVMAYDNLAPHQIAFWALDLARAFHPMYDRVRVLHTEVPEEVGKARLRLYRAAKVVFKRALTLLGMSTPERM